MPILTLNSAKINYHYSIGYDNFIISEIVNSRCSYEVPIVIRDKQTLDLYFGQSYPERGYHNELLSNGVSLFLYRPISNKKRILEEDNYISDLEERDKEYYISFELFPESTSAREEILYVDTYSGEKYIWNKDLSEYINIKNLPQNLFSEEKYESWYNRDTLRLCSNRVFDLAEKYKDGNGDDFYLLESDDESFEESELQHESSSEADSFEFFNYINKNIKIYTSNSYLDFFIVIPEGNNIPSILSMKDIYPDKSYHISVILDNGDELKNLLWLEKKSIITLINSRLSKESFLNRISSCGQIKQIRIYKEITSKYKNPIISCYPRYRSDYLVNYKKGISLVQYFSENPEYYNDIISGDRTLAFSLIFPESLTMHELRETLFYSKIIDGEEQLFGRYLGIPLPGKLKKSLLIQFSLNSSTNNEIGEDYIRAEDRVTITIDQNSTWEVVFNNIEEILSNRGYCCERLKDYPDRGLLIYSYLGSVPNIGFSNIFGLELTSEFSITHDLLSIETDSLKRIEFYSKTIGPNDDNIKVKIEPINYYPDKYRITISRFSYSEVFDLNLYETPDKDGKIESMDNIINRNSKLVRCSIFKTKPDGTLWKEGDQDGKLPIGEWELKRSIDDIPTTQKSESYWAALEYMAENTVKEDFICIPKIENFLKIDDKINYNLLGYFPEYESILEYCRLKNSQALIGNLDFYVSENFPGINETPVERTIYKRLIGIDQSDNSPIYNYVIYWEGSYRNLSLSDNHPILQSQNTYIYNYNLDTSNYLVYFFRDMSIDGIYPRPAYYLFLNGLLTGDYSISTNNISYNPPIKNSYVEEKIESELQFRKSNYLVSNGHQYFYKNYQNHSGDNIYKTTILTRFAVSKVSRTFENNKKELFDTQTVGEMKSKINQLLLGLINVYSIYSDIRLVDCIINYQTKSILIRVAVYIRELVDKPISLDIELNYIY